jgi:hypothetical protein
MEQVTVYYGNNKVPTGKYSNKDGAVFTYIDRDRIDPNATARRIEFEEQRHKSTEHFNAIYERFLQETERCNDNGRN